ncbi:MAG: hypothetical protein ACE5H3_08625, partial [Planctomycetota bacterium]
AWRDLLQIRPPRVLEREDRPDLLDPSMPGVGVERISLDGPAGHPLEMLLARPVGDGLPCALVAGRAVQENPDVLGDLRPLLEMGHAVLVCESYRGALPDAVREWSRNEKEIWRRERASRSLRMAFHFLDGESWSHPERRYMLGMSRGGGLILPAAVQELGVRLLVLLVPVPWLPQGRLSQQVPHERLDLVGSVFHLLDANVIGPALQDMDTAVVLATEDDPGVLGGVRKIHSFLGPRSRPFRVKAGHRFPFSAAMEKGLGGWIQERLAPSWTPPARKRDIPEDVLEAKKRVLAWQAAAREESAGQEEAGKPRDETKGPGGG